MTLPNITVGSLPDGRFYSEFTPDGMVNKVRLYGSTRDEAEQEAFSFLEEHDREVRKQRLTDPKTYLDRLMADALRPAPTTDVVNHPDHYTRFPVEVIELTENLNFCRGNAVKYLCRAGAKDASKELEDLEKAKWYVQREIDRLRRVSE